MRLAASQVIERPPAEVFRFVATEHFQNHPKWDPAVTAITKTSPGPIGVGTTARLVRTDRGRQLHGSMEVTKYEPVSSFSEVSRFGPFSLRARATLAPGGAGEHQTGAGDRYPCPWGDPVAASADAGGPSARRWREPSHYQAVHGSDRVAHDVTHLETQRDLLHAMDGMPSCAPLLGAFAAGQRQIATVRSIPLLSPTVR